MTTLLETDYLLNLHVDILFPAINKNHLISDNDFQIFNNRNMQRCVIKKVIRLERHEFETIANSFLDDRPQLWEQIGGRGESMSTEVIAVNPHAGVNQYQKGWFMPFFVNTEGYDYARYVGRARHMHDGPYREFLLNNYDVRA